MFWIKYENGIDVRNMIHVLKRPKNVQFSIRREFNVYSCGLMSYEFMIL